MSSLQRQLYKHMKSGYMLVDDDKKKGGAAGGAKGDHTFLCYCIYVICYVTNLTC